MVNSVKDRDGKEISDNKLRNEAIDAVTKDLSQITYNDEVWNIEKIATDRKGFRQLRIVKD